MFSAQVVLNANDARIAEEVTRLFSAAGFQVGPPGAGGIPISAKTETFEKFFHVSLSGQRPSSDNELPVSAIPTPLRAHVSRIVYTSLSFGPGADF